MPTELVTIPPQPPLVTKINTTIAIGARSNLDLTGYYNEKDITSSEVAASWGIMSVRHGVNWNTIKD